ncbi:MAG: sugar transferase [Anaerolineae bacterium]|nr:sugar transferase [Anaerolineae bacterium]
MENVQILLLATGETDKLRPLTEETPSPMIPVVDRPAMLYTVESLARQNVKNISVSLYHLAGNVEAYFGRGQRWGIEFEYLLQRDALGSAGALKWAQAAGSQTIVVIPGDMLIDFDIEAVVAAHRKNQSIATMLVHLHGSDTASIVCLDDAKNLTVDEGKTWYNTGVYIFEPAVLDHIPDRTPFDIYTQLLPSLMAAGITVRGCEIEGYWNPIATFPDYHEAQRHILNSASGNKSALNGLPALKNPSLEARQISPGIWVGRNHMIHPTVRLTPPVYVGRNCQVGSDVELGPDVVIGSYVVIDDDATISQSTILDHTYVGQLVNIESRFVDKNIVIDSLTSESTEVVDYFLLDRAHTAILDNELLRIWDFVLAFVLILLTLILTVPLGLLVFLTSGHIFKRVSRVGGWATVVHDGDTASLKSCELLHFYTRKENGRYTPLGHWLEKWEGHRLPELWNVLKGDLRLVGVKPLKPEEIKQISEVWQQKRHDHTPGFTGMWYLQTNPQSNLDDILIADAYYIAIRSWREDLKILKQTPSAWRRRSNSWKIIQTKNIEALP